LTVLRAALERALSSGFPEVSRLSYARTSVTFRIAGDGESATLLLDRTPPEIGDREQPGEVEIELAAGDIERFASGSMPMPTAVVGGTVHTRGPIRKYLEVDSILRHVLAQSGGSPGHQDDAGPRPRTNGTRHTTANPDLLAIETRKLHKSFGPHQILRGVDLAIPEGVISVLLGPSGTGKSVVLKHVIGLLRPDAGEVFIRGDAHSARSRGEILALRTEIGVMFQDGALFSAMDVYDNVAFPLRQHTDLGEHEIREVVMDRLDGVGLTHAVSRFPSQLSGGMKKRAGLARALVMDPGIVLCDEPDSGLDPVRTALLGDVLVEQHGCSGGTMLVITHNVALAKRIADHMSVLWQGQVLESGTAEEVLNSSSQFVQQFLAGDSVGPLGMDA
jgi:phospholipid/cholesterol/gamma-HCH transport system ATP-binding protein